MFLVPRSSEAQLAPTGAHYAARSSDTGYAGPNGSGGYSTSVPLDLPAARGGLPIPLQIVSGAPRYGALGVGWDIPLSYVYMDYSVARHRPDPTSSTEAAPRTRVFVTLPGRNVEMIRKENTWPTVWVGRDAPDLEMTSTGPTWILYDGNGLTYKFGLHAYMARMGGPSLASGGMWLLDDIIGRGGASVHLDYETRAVKVHDYDPQESVVINLTGIRYNPAPGAPQCFKNEVSIRYNTTDDTRHPYAISIIGSRAVARYSKVAAIDVTSRESCGTNPVVLRTYDFTYSPDADTHQDRLTSVSMTGRRDRPDKDVRIPIARFKYGSATVPGMSGPTLMFDDNAPEQDQVPLPAPSLDIGRTEKVSTALFQSPDTFSRNAYALTQTLIDFTGDGRPDFVWYDPADNYLHISRNIPGPGGATTFGPPAILNDSTFTRRVLDIRTLAKVRFDKDDQSHDANRELVWTQTIDVNGDGRLDVIDAADTEDYWIVFLNTPDPTVPSGIKWEKRAYYVKPMRLSFGGGFSFNSNFVPLAQRTTQSDYVEAICWYFKDGGWHDNWLWPCTQIPEGTPKPYVDPPIQRTVTEWELKDINGDGFPDVVRNAQAVALRVSADSGHPSDAAEGNAFWALRKYSLMPPGGGYQVLVALNILGHYLPKPTTTDVSFASFTPYTSGDCGVAEWRVLDDSPVTQGLVCDLIDINADSIPDRVVGQRAYLGTGSGFDAATLDLPLPSAVPAPRHAAVQKNLWTETCKTNSTFESWQDTSIRDVTGDGIPDFVTFSAIYPGTSAGFADNAPLYQHALTTLSSQKENCNGQLSRTTSGLIDIDGDGVSEILDTYNGKLRIRSLSSGESRHRVEASRLVETETGQGAVTHIVYRSAKEDWTTPHQIPYPEIVVSAVTTSGGRGLSTPLATTFYAYGSISEFFDPIADAFRATGYLRRVELVTPGEVNPSQRIAFPQNIATITDSYGFEPIGDPTMVPFVSEELRVGRYLIVGRPREVNTLKSFVNDPWLLLPLDIATASNRIAGTKYSVDPWSTTLIRGASPEKCVEMIFPYDFALSKQYNSTSWNVCAVGGFLYTNTVRSWRGSAAPPSADNVETIEQIKAIDSKGRPTSFFHGGDLWRSDDDVCVETTYAEPTGMNERVLSAVASTKVWNCGDKVNITYSEESFEYDHLLPGVVSSGLVTGHTIYKHATDDGTYLGTIRELDISYDGNANPSKVSRVRSDDGATRTVRINYDAWGLVPTTTTTEATGAKTLTTSADVDLISNEVLGVTDPNGSRSGMTYDALGRPVLSLFSGPGGALNATAARSYVGFEENATEAPHVLVKTFTDPVPQNQVWTSEGRASTTYIDELGRIRYSEVALGDDYNNSIMIGRARTYDRLGRVAFEADPFVLPSGQTPQAAASSSYGTTYHFEIDGSLARMIRGRGRQPFGAAADLATETLPYAFAQSYSNHTHISAAAAPDSAIPGSPQYGVTSLTTSTAIGRTIKRETTQTSRLELAEYGYDVFGQLTRVIRYATPTTPALPVTWTMRYDSRGELLELSEPAVAKQYRTFSDFGELKAISSGNTAPYQARQIKNEYDGLGRLVSTAEYNDGVIDPATLMTYKYDVANATPLLTPTNVLGRLTAATSPTLSVSLSYDDFGNVASKSYVDPTSTEYIEQRASHADGSLASLTLRLPDNGYATERAEYAYDSAGRPRWMWFSDGRNTQELYNATNVDAHGRVRAATFGNSNAYTADYYDTGRLLPKRAGVTTPSGMRDLAFGSFDAAGRELSRTESYGGGPSTDSSLYTTYDAVGRIQNTTTITNGIPGAQWAFAYDALGNTRTLDNQPSSVTKLSISTTDRDRICSVSYGGSPSIIRCNVLHNDLGAVQRMPTQTGTRELDYFNSGAIKKLWDSSGAEARFSYDPFGAVSQLDIDGPVSRSDRNFGDFIKQRSQRGPFGSTNIITRTFPGPGVRISRRGTKQAWLFEMAEERGTRYTLDQDGNFIQDIDYSPFGAASSFGAMPGNLMFTSAQWNSGDALEGFGLVQVGARIYDPVIGRFLSRDPLMIPRGASTTNPYAFAWNDPMNGSDPTGLDPLSDIWGAITATFTSAAAPGQTNQSNPDYLPVALGLSGAAFGVQILGYDPHPHPSSAPPTPRQLSVPEWTARSLFGQAIGGQYAPRSPSAGDYFEFWQQTFSLGGESVEAELHGVGDSIREGRWLSALWHAKNFIDDIGNIYAMAGGPDRLSRLLSIKSELPPIPGGTPKSVEFYGPKSLREMAREVHGAADDPRALKRTIAIGQDAEGNLWAGSSNGFDKGHQAALDRLGITRVVGSKPLHAEGELLRADQRGLFKLKSVGTWSRMPCADAGFMCAERLEAHGVTVVGGSGIFPGL